MTIHSHTGTEPDPFGDAVAVALGCAGVAAAELGGTVVVTVTGGTEGLELVTAGELVLPAGAPNRIVARLYQDTAKALQLPGMREKLAAQGLDVVGSRPEQLAATIRSEIAKWAKVVKASGARAD